MSLQSKRVFVAGSFKELDQIALKRRLKSRGARVMGKFTAKADLLVAGERVKAAVMEKAEQWSVPVVSELAILPMVGIEALNTRLSLLRQVAHDTPSAQSWEALCGLLDDWPLNKDLHLGIDYIESALVHWPEALRIAPERWIDDHGYDIPLDREDGPRVRGKYARDPRLAIARVSQPEEGPGYLFVIPDATSTSPYLDPSPAPTPPAVALRREGDLLQRIGADGEVLVERRFDTPERWGTEIWEVSHSGRCVWFFGHNAETEAGSAWLLDVDTFEILDKWDNPLGDGWTNEIDVCYSPNGDAIALSNNAGDSHMGLFVFSEQAGKISVNDEPMMMGQSGGLIGFSPCGTRIAAVESLGGLLRLWSWPEAEALRCNIIGGLQYEGDYGPMLLIGRWPMVDGLYAHMEMVVIDPLTGEHHTSVCCPFMSGYVNTYLDVVSQRILKHSNGRIMRFLPSLALLERFPDRGV